MNQDGDNKWRELCQAAATEQDSTRLMELVSQIDRAFDERDKKLKSSVIKKGAMKAPLG